MNQARFQSIYRGLTTVAQRVYAAIPIAQAWNTQEINADLLRLNHRIDKRTLAGVLESLKQSGLIMEPIRDYWRRKKIAKAGDPNDQIDEDVEAEKLVTESPLQDPSKQNQETATMTEKAAAIETLAALADRAKNIGAAVCSLAADIEKAAIEIDEDAGKQKDEIAQLHQLRQLLKGLG